MEAERERDLPRGVELGFMLVICTQPCWASNPGVAFFSRQCYVVLLRWGSPRDSCEPMAVVTVDSE